MKLDDTYMPFTEAQLRMHFAKIGKSEILTDEKHFERYLGSLERYQEAQKKMETRGSPITEMRKPFQIQKDELFWTAGTLMTIFHSNERARVAQFSDLLKKAFGDTPPLQGSTTWEDLLSGNLHLFFEANLPSPVTYKEWLQKNLPKFQMIPYVIDSALSKKDGSVKPGLEGATNVDSLLINENGFAVLFESKVLSDISYQTTYNVERNQIARSIDVMLEKNKHLADPLWRRDPKNTLFVLITPRRFKEKPGKRLYWYKMDDYTKRPEETLRKDLQHRLDLDVKALSKRLGWLTWEDFKEVNSDCCKWLDEAT